MKNFSRFYVSGSYLALLALLILLPEYGFAGSSDLFGKIQGIFTDGQKAVETISKSAVVIGWCIVGIGKSLGQHWADDWIKKCLWGTLFVYAFNDIIAIFA